MITVTTAGRAQRRHQRAVLRPGVRHSVRSERLVRGRDIAAQGTSVGAYGNANLLTNEIGTADFSGIDTQLVTPADDTRATANAGVPTRLRQR